MNRDEAINRLGPPLDGHTTRWVWQAGEANLVLYFRKYSSSGESGGVNYFYHPHWGQSTSGPLPETLVQTFEAYKKGFSGEVLHYVRPPDFNAHAHAQGSAALCLGWIDGGYDVDPSGLREDLQANYHVSLVRYAHQRKSKALGSLAKILRPIEVMRVFAEGELDLFKDLLEAGAPASPGLAYQYIHLLNEYAQRGPAQGSTLWEHLEDLE